MSNVHDFDFYGSYPVDMSMLVSLPMHLKSLTELQCNVINIFIFWSFDFNNKYKPCEANGFLVH